MLTQVLTNLGVWSARLALVALLVQADNPYRLAAGLAFIAAQVPIQRALLAGDARGRLAHARLA